MRIRAPLLAFALLGCADDTGWIVAVTLEPQAPTTVDTLRCRAPTGERNVIIEHAWEVDGELVSDAQTEVLEPEHFVKGQRVTCVVRPTRRGQRGSPIRTEVEIANSPPRAERVEIAPSTATAGTELRCEVDGIDDDGDELAWVRRWQIDGEPDVEGELLPAGALRRGQTVQCIATPSDGTDDGEPRSSDLLTVRNAPPIIASVELSPEAPGTDAPLTAHADVLDPDGDEVTVTYAWHVDGELAQGGTRADLDPAAYVKGQHVRVTVIGRDDLAVGESVQAEVTIRNTAPTAPTLAVLPSLGVEQVDDLVCAITEPATDADDDAITTEFAWTVDGLAVETSSQTWLPGDTIDAALTYDGQRWTCEATATDDEDRGPSATAEAAVTSWTGPRVFTSCGATGPFGPESAACDDAYAGERVDGEVTVEDGVQRWTVPESGRYRIRAAGAQGADTSRFAEQDGGRGAILEAEIALVAGEELTILVGQAGVNSGGTFLATTGGLGGPSGGGGSFVLRDDTTPLIVAGGGGGAGTLASDAQHGTTTMAGARGNLRGGEAPASCYAWTTSDGGAAGGTDGEGGCTNIGFGGGGLLTSGAGDCGGNAAIDGGWGGQPSAYEGGFGGGGCGNWNNYGGGGGGYSGGGGGNNNEGSGGGGGGSYVIAGATGVRTSDGTYEGSATFEGVDIDDLGIRSQGHGEVVIDLAGL